MRVIEGNFAAISGQIALVASRFNHLIVDSLVKGASDRLLRQGLTQNQIDIVYCPGAYELPFVCQQVAKTGKYKGIVALGAIIRGATAHFDYVASECSSGLAQVARAFNLPVTFGVLTTDTIEQALERAGTKAGNKGEEAACALLELINVVEKIHG